MWIYVRYVLEQIREDPQSAHELPGLPRGLEAWYHNDLTRLIDSPDGSGLYLPLLATLTVTPEPLPARTLAALAGIADEPGAERSLDHALRPYCRSCACPQKPAVVSESAIPA